LKKLSSYKREKLIGNKLTKRTVTPDPQHYSEFLSKSKGQYDANKITTVVEPFFGGI
jgi:hypothetical protein